MCCNFPLLLLLLLLLVVIDDNLSPSLPVRQECIGGWGKEELWQGSADISWEADEKEKKRGEKGGRDL